LSKKPKAKQAKPEKAQASSLPSELGGHVIANIVCSECGNKFTTAIGLGNFAEEVGGKFTCPTCGALFSIISVQKSRITVEVLAKGETRTYGKTYDIATRDYARPL
jgi:transcription elongation factor Elf1